MKSHRNIHSVCQALTMAAHFTAVDGAARTQTPIRPAELVAPKIGITGGTLNFTIEPSVVGRH